MVIWVENSNEVATRYAQASLWICRVQLFSVSSRGTAESITPLRRCESPYAISTTRGSAVVGPKGDSINLCNVMPAVWL